MELVSFRIYNYKSIIDSGECYLAKDITIFAGKNESGKTNILEALEHFNLDKEFNENHFPVHKEGVQPKIEVTFSLAVEDLPNFKKSDLEKELASSTELKLTIVKEYPGKYKFSEESLSKLGLLKYKEYRINVQKKIEEIYENLIPLHKENVPTQSNIELPKVNFSDYKLMLEKFSNYNNQILDANHKVNNKNIVRNKINDLISSLKTIEKNVLDLEYTNEFVHWMPYFVFFKSLEDILPNKINIENFSSDQWISAFEKISKFNPDLIKSDESLKKVNHEKTLNLEVNEEFAKYWKQDDSEIVIRWNNDYLYFWIDEDNEHFKPSMRSKGKQWYLSFYILVSAKTKEKYDNIILIDEPGLYLHAKAQKDVLSRLLDLPAQILFSTHSPYLLDSDELGRIRAVFKNENNTKIENKLHKISDKETLTPILTTIGLGINDGITNLDKAKNVIVEGPSDYYYLNAFMKIFEEGHFKVIHGGGATNMPHVGTILQGWGCDVYYLFDNDRGFKQGKNNLNKDWACTTEEIIGKIPIQNAAIEDVLSKADYHSLVLKEDTFKKSKKNSTIAKEENRDKVLDSKTFYEEVITGKIDLDKESEKNIKKLLEELSSKF